MSQFYDQASLVMVPSGYKSGKIYSQKPLSTDGELAFSRASNATRVVLDASGQQRLEKVRTNLVKSSGDISTQSTYWTSNQSGSTTQNAAIAPDGTTTAAQITSAGSSYSGVTQSVSVAAVPHTYSCYLKATSGTPTIRLTFFDGVTFHQGNFTITSEWARYSFTFTPLAGSFAVYNTCSSVATWLAWGAQLEASDVMTDYIATTTTPVSVGPVSGLPRLDYSGGCPSLLLEPQRTNNITFSENQGPSGTNWYPSTTWTVTNNTVTSPSGYQDADTLTETTTFDFHSGYFSAGIAAGYTGTYTISAFAKYNGRFFVLSPKGATERTYFNLQTGTVAQLGGGGVTAKIEDYGSGWYRCSVTCSFSGENVNFEHLLASAAGTLQYTGDGTSGVHIWGCMAEEGAYATSYIPTLSSAVTRVADAASKTGISSLIGQTEGTVYIEMSPIGGTTSYTERVLRITGGTDEVGIQRYGNDRIVAYGISGGVSSWSVDVPNIFSAGQVEKIAIGYKLNDVAVYVNGVQIGTDTSAAMFTSLANLFFANDASAGLMSPQKVSQLLLFKTRLSNADLATLTSL